MNGIGITSNTAQMAIYEGGNVRSQMKLARSTQDVDVQSEIADSKNIRVLTSLASNVDLHEDVEVKLAEMDNPRINSALLNRTVEDI